MLPNATPLEWAWVGTALLATIYAALNRYQTLLAWWAVVPTGTSRTLWRAELRAWRALGRVLRHGTPPPDPLPAPDGALIRTAEMAVRARNQTLMVNAYFLLLGIRACLLVPAPGASWDTVAVSAVAIGLLIRMAWGAWRTNQDEAAIRAAYRRRLARRAAGRFSKPLQED